MTYHLKKCTTALDIEADCDWDEVEVRDFKETYGTSRQNYIICSKYPAKEGKYFDFEQDAWNMPIEDFKKKWGIIKLHRLGKYHCGAGYTNLLEPEKSYFGHNPDLIKWLKELDNVSES